MARPVSSSVGVSFPYGVRYSNGKIHKGVDFSDGSEGGAVYSCLNGVVTYAGIGGGWGPAYGRHVIIKSTFQGRTKWMLYGHMKTEIVRVGQSVKAGEKIGTIGGRRGASYSGNSTGPHLHVQAGHANNYLAYESPWPMINYVPVPPKPADPPPLWFRLGGWNLAGFDAVHGKASWDDRDDDMIAKIRDYKADVWAFQEVPNPKVDAFAAKLKAVAGLTVRAGTDGRYIATANGMKTGRYKTITLTERGPANDTKQVVFLECWPIATGNPVLIECGHLENRTGSAYDEVRVTQGKQIRALGDSIGEAWRIPPSRRFFANDENSDSYVSAQAFGSTYPDAFNVAYATQDGSYRSLIGWEDPPTKGPRIDKIHVHKTRPIRRATLALSAGHRSDHLPTVITVGKIT